MPISISIIIILGIAIIASQIRRWQKNKKYDLFLIFSVIFFFSYIVSPIAAMLWGDIAINRHFSEGEVRPAVLAVALYAPLSYLSVSFGWVLSKKLSVNRWTPQNTLSNRTWKLAFIILFLMGFFFFFLFVTRYGGVSTIFEKFLSIRSGAVERDNLGSLSKHLSEFIVIAFYIIAHKFITQKYFRTFSAFLALVTVAICALLVQYLSGGRGAIVLFGLIPYISFLHTRQHLPGAIALMVGFFLIATVALGDFALLKALAQLDIQSVQKHFFETRIVSNFSKTIPATLSNFSHPFLSIPVALEYIQDSSKIRGFIDIPLGILFYFRALGIPIPDTLAYIHTENVTGIRESVMPPGLIAGSIYSLGTFGVVIGGFTFGSVGRIFDSILDNYAKTLPWFTPIYIMSIYSFAGFINASADFRQFIMNFSLLSFIIFSFLIVRWRTAATP